MMANISARNGAATMPNSTAAMPSSPRAKRRTVLMRNSVAAERAALFRPRGRPDCLDHPATAPDTSCDARGTTDQAIRLNRLILSKITLSNCCLRLKTGSAAAFTLR